MNGSNGKLIDLLERIAGNTEDTNKRLDDTNRRLDETNQKLDALREETRAGFVAVNGRLDNVITFSGVHHADHEQRIRALEDQVFKKSS